MDLFTFLPLSINRDILGADDDLAAALEEGMGLTGAGAPDPAPEAVGNMIAAANGFAIGMAAQPVEEKDRKARFGQPVDPDGAIHHSCSQGPPGGRQ